MKLDGCYTQLLRFSLGYKWSDFISNVDLYAGLPRISNVLLLRKLHFAGHCQRATFQPISDLLFWDLPRLSGRKCTRGAGSRANYAKILLKECASVVNSDVELAKLMLDRDDWRNRIAFIIRNQNCN